jgi:hypothetical protein
MTIQSSRDVALRAAHFCTENCTESGKSVQFQPISSVSKRLKFNRYVNISGSIATAALTKKDWQACGARLPFRLPFLAQPSPNCPNSYEKRPRKRPGTFGPTEEIPIRNPLLTVIPKPPQHNLAVIERKL